MEEINFKRPGMEEKELLESYFKKYPSRSCDRTFVNVYLWSRAYGVEYAAVENTIVFRSQSEQGCAFAYPVGKPEDVKKALEALQECCGNQGKGVRFYSVTAENFEQIEQWYPDTFEIVYDRDAADYVYEVEKLSTLAGKKLHAKRNHINKFKLTYEDWEYEAISEANVEECFQMALKWRNENDCDGDSEKNKEMCVTLNSLRLFEELGLVGGILRVEGEIVAFTLGEPISADTFVVHIEKAFAEIQGAYPMINQQFILHECQNYTYVNREEDMGEEGMRKAKLSYRPAFLVEKGVVTKK